MDDSEDGDHGEPQFRNQLKQFSGFELSPALRQRLANADFVQPTPVQAAAIPPALDGRDILTTAQTGMGKTPSFLLPLIERTPAAGSGVAALVLLPTRELAMRVFETWRRFTQSNSSRLTLLFSMVSPLGLEPRTHASKGRSGQLCTELHSDELFCKSSMIRRRLLTSLSSDPLRRFA